jgi:hypothetical protein
MDPEEALNINRNDWGKIAAKFHGKTALPHHGPLTKLVPTTMIIQTRKARDENTHSGNGTRATVHDAGETK